MALSLAERGAGTLLNELFAVAEKSEQLSARFALSGNLFEIPNWSLLHSANYYIHPFLSTLQYTDNLLRFLLIHDRAHRSRRQRSRRQRGICSLPPDSARVEKLLNVDLSRLEDGDMQMPISQI